MALKPSSFKRQTMVGKSCDMLSILHNECSLRGDRGRPLMASPSSCFMLTSPFLMFAATSSLQAYTSQLWHDLQGLSESSVKSVH